MSSSCCCSNDPLNVGNIKKSGLEVREDPQAGTYVPNLLYADVKEYREVFHLVATGEAPDDNSRQLQQQQQQYYLQYYLLFKFW